MPAASSPAYERMTLSARATFVLISSGVFQICPSSAFAASSSCVRPPAVSRLDLLEVPGHEDVVLVLVQPEVVNLGLECQHLFGLERLLEVREVRGDVERVVVRARGRGLASDAWSLFDSALVFSDRGR